jgi:hypothetical protein
MSLIQELACIFVAHYLGIGVGFCIMMRSEKKPGHWLNYPMLVVGWPIISLIYTRPRA